MTTCVVSIVDNKLLFCVIACPVPRSITYIFIRLKLSADIGLDNRIFELKFSLFWIFVKITWRSWKLERMGGNAGPTRPSPRTALDRHVHCLDGSIRMVKTAVVSLYIYINVYFIYDPPQFYCASVYIM